MKDHRSRPPGGPGSRSFPRFSIMTLILVMLVGSMMGAAGSYYWRATHRQNEGDEALATLQFVAFTVSVPAIGVIVTSVVYRVITLWNGPR